MYIMISRHSESNHITLSNGICIAGSWSFREAARSFHVKNKLESKESFTEMDPRPQHHECHRTGHMHPIVAFSVL